MRPKPRSIMSPSTARRRVHHAHHVELEHAAELRRVGLGERRALARCRHWRSGCRSGRAPRRACFDGGVDRAPRRSRRRRRSPAACPAATASFSGASWRPSTVTAAPAPRQRRRDGAADAASAAGHQSVPSVENCHAAPLGCRRFCRVEITLSFKFPGFKQSRRLARNYFKLKVIPTWAPKRSPETWGPVFRPAPRYAGGAS